MPTILIRITGALVPFGKEGTSLAWYRRIGICSPKKKGEKKKGDGGNKYYTLANQLKSQFYSRLLHSVNISVSKYYIVIRICNAKKSKDVHIRASIPCGPTR